MTERTFRWIVVLLLSLAVGNIWLGTGSLSPASSSYGVVWYSPECGYLYNTDHAHHKALFSLLTGRPREEWELSIVLRRILFPLVALPFTSVWGFEVGGVVASMLLHLATIGLFVRFVAKEFSRSAAVWIGVLLATYPGITYASGTPYYYASIVPCTLLMFMGLWRLQREERFFSILMTSLGVGVLFLAYDLFPLFLPALVLTLACRRRWRALIPAAFVAMLPLGLWLFVLSQILKVRLINSNSEGYREILHAYLTSSWDDVSYLLTIPSTFISNFFASTFFVLGWLSLAATAILVITRKNIPLPAACILFGATLQFLFLECAPPYDAIPMRGTWLARFYQPIFIALLAIVASSYEALATTMQRKIAAACIIVAAIAQEAICVGPTLDWNFSYYVNYRFYEQAPPEVLKKNLARFGRTPLHACIPHRLELHRWPEFDARRDRL